MKSAINTDMDAQEMMEEATVSLFPNPANDVVYIAAEGNKISHVTIIDLSGKVVKEMVIDLSENVEVDVNDLTSGMYTVSVHLSNGSISNDMLTIQ